MRVLDVEHECNVEQNLSAQVAANETGVREIRRMMDQFGLEVVQAYMGHVQDNAERFGRRVIGVLKDSAYCYPLDDGAMIKVCISIDTEWRAATIDFSGTSAQQPGNYDAPAAICRAVGLYVFRTLVGSDIPLNDGCLKPIDIVLPARSMISPEFPAAVVAGSQGTMNKFVYGNEHHQNYETICGGAGARQSFHGASAVHTHMTNTRMTDPEVLEARFPVRVEKFAIRQGSGGRGVFRGGDGIDRELMFLEPMTTTVLSTHRKTQPFGVDSGEPGQPGYNAVLRCNGEVEELEGNDSRKMSPGNVFIIKTPGGGGYGP